MDPLGDPRVDPLSDHDLDPLSVHEHPRFAKLSIVFGI